MGSDGGFITADWNRRSFGPDQTLGDAEQKSRIFTFSISEVTVVSSRRLFLGFAISTPLAVLLAQDTAKQAGLERVDAKYVCFVNKHRFDKAQLPVEVDGRTYYGCCEMCKSKLQKDPASRFDTDPVSGKRVDKAAAVIGADANGKVYFFENEDNLKQFRPPASGK